MNRREFLKLSAYLITALNVGLIPANRAMASKPTPPSIKGSIVAACYNPQKEGPYSSDKYQTVLSRLDLETGLSERIPIKMTHAHDVLKVKDKYIVLPNTPDVDMHVSDFSNDTKKINIGDGKAITGHGFYDEEQGIVIVSTKDFSKDQQAGFAILDPDNQRFIDYIHVDGHDPHDIQLYNKDTLAICNYNTKQYNPKNSKNYFSDLNDDKSYISLIDRKTFKLKEKIPAYSNAMVSHATVTRDGDLYAIGFQEYNTALEESWNGEYIEEKFHTFFKNHHPELLPQWPDIAKNLKIHRVEKSINNFGLPLLPVKLNKQNHSLETLSFPHFHHRRAQSICYVRETNTVCMSYPNSDSVQLYNCTTHKTHDFSGTDLNLKEMRGIAEIEGTSFLAIAGIRRGITIVDTSDNTIVKHFDTKLGRIIHMHHIV